MAAQLLQCTKEEPRAVIRFLWSERVKTVEIHRRMLFQYVKTVVSPKEKCTRGWSYSEMEERAQGIKDWVRPILENYQARGETVNSEHYRAILTDGLKPVIRMKRTVVANRKFRLSA